MTEWRPPIPGEESNGAAISPHPASSSPAAPSSDQGPQADGVEAQQPSQDTIVAEALRRAEGIMTDAAAAADKIRGEAHDDAEQIRADARKEAEMLLKELGAQLTDMGDAYRRAIREARDTVHQMADRVQETIRAEPGQT